MRAGVPVWDAPVRLFHWALAVLVVFSFVTGKVAGSWLEWHMRSGYAILALLGFRLAWGFAGGTTARFASFLRGPRAAWGHLREAFASRPPPVFGHNPAGGWMVLLMLTLLLLQAASGLFIDDEISTRGPLAVKVSNAVVARMSRIHYVNQWVVLGALTVHVAAIVYYQWVLRVDLVGPMVHGRSTLEAGEARPGSNVVAAVLLAAASAAVYWLVVVFPRAAA